MKFETLRTAVAWRYYKYATPVLAALYRNSAAPDTVDRLLARQTCVILQNGRSGGTLLLRLFDNHPSLNVRPYHYMWLKGNRSHEDWYDDDDIGRLGTSVAALWRRVVYDARLYRYRRFGFAKRWGKSAETGVIHIDIDCLAYFLSFRKALKSLGASSPPYTASHVLTAELTGFFASWKNYTNRTDPKAANIIHVTTNNYAHVGRKLLSSLDQGKIITILRDPSSWVASYLKAARAEDSFDETVSMYERYLEDVAIFLSQADPEKVIFVEFSSLVENPQEVMERLCAFLNVAPKESLLCPTTNGVETTPNTSFPDQERKGRIDTNVLRRGQFLEEAQREVVASRLDMPYGQVIAALRERGLLYRPVALKPA